MSFPKLSPVLETGLDGPANFAFNYFFANGIQTGVDVIFTYGPLGFLKAPLPLGNNLGYAILILSVMRLLFAFLLLYLGKLINPQKWMLHFFIVLILSQLVSFDLTLLGIIIISLLICKEKKQNGIWFFVAMFFTILGVLIKASLGITSLLIIFSFLVLDYYDKRSFRSAIIFLFGSSLLFLLIWILLYGNFYGILNYFYGTFQLIKGNSSAVALHPYNNWLIVILFILIFLLLPFFIKDKRIYFLYGLLLLSVFAFWKYSFSREENFHLKSLLDYLILFFAIVLIYSKNIKALHLALMGVCLMLYYMNMDFTEKYKIDDRVNFIGINNFISATAGYDEWIESCNNQTERNLLPKILENDILTYIDNKTIDIYPWDYSYIAANDLNWIPRPLIQCYAAYTSWLDRLNADHFASSKAPDFMLWELSKKNVGDEFGDIDERYLLNDEPNTIYQLLNKYKIIRKDRQLLLLERTEKNNLSEPVIISSEESMWNEWIKVPDVNDGILRVKFYCKGNLLRIFRNLIYKDAAFFIEYKLENEKIYKYRIVPENAKDGIWINPLLIKVSDEYIEPLVTAIRFSNSVNSLMKDDIHIDWELIKIDPDRSIEIILADSNLINEKYLSAFSIFGKNSVSENLIIGFNDFEDIYEGWSENKDKLSKVLSYSGDYSIKLDTANSFSPSYSISIGDLSFPPSSTINIKASVFAYLTKGGEGNIVITVENGSNIKYWNAVNLQELSIPNVWNKIGIDKNLPHDLKPSDVIKIYVWNNGYNDFYVDDFEVKIENAK